MNAASKFCEDFRRHSHSAGTAEDGETSPEHLRDVLALYIKSYKHAEISEKQPSTSQQNRVIQNEIVNSSKDVMANAFLSMAENQKGGELAKEKFEWQKTMMSEQLETNKRKLVQSEKQFRQSNDQFDKKLCLEEKVLKDRIQRSRVQSMKENKGAAFKAMMDAKALNCDETVFESLKEDWNEAREMHKQSVKVLTNMEI